MENDKGPPKEKDMKLKELVKVWGLAEAGVVKSFLESNGISCILSSHMVQSVYPFSTDGLGQIKILVSESNYPLAKKLLEEKPIPEDK